MKKTSAFFLCILLSFSLAACSGKGSSDLPGNPSDSEGVKEDSVSGEPKDSQDSSSSGEGADDSQEPLLGEDATDEEVLEALKDDINVVDDDNYVEMVTAFQEHPEEHSGKLYQIEGAYTKEDGASYIARTLVDGEKSTMCGIPLAYMSTEPKEGDWIQVTGVIDEGEINGETVTVLEVVVLQTMEEQGQAELQAR